MATNGTVPGTEESRRTFVQASETTVAGTTVAATSIGDMETLLDNFCSSLASMKSSIDRYKGRKAHTNCPHCGTPIRK